MQVCCSCRREEENRECERGDSFDNEATEHRSLGRAFIRVVTENKPNNFSKLVCMR